MIASLISLYRPGYVTALVYMLQSSEYKPGPYLKWYWRTARFDKVRRRRQLVGTKAAKLLKYSLVLGVLLQIIAGISVIWLWRGGHLKSGLLLGVGLIISYPVLWAHLVIVPLFLGNILIVQPSIRQKVRTARKVFESHKGVKIAIAGSYGKTSLKELLVTVLGEGKKVAATTGNKNVLVSQAAFGLSLDGNEDVLIIEYGEGQPGDVLRFAKLTTPNIGIITGVAPAHLDKYKTVSNAGKDIFQLADYLKDKEVYVNGDSHDAAEFIKPTHHIYSNSGLGEWRVGALEISANSTGFIVKKGSVTLRVSSQLIGRHQVGPLVLAAVIASNLGLSKQQIETGLAKTKPYEHRMRPRIVGGATIIDDTYNGNIEGMRAGLKLLAELKARRKIYVTPGLVDQGPETVRVHHNLGQAIAEAKPDLVVLMDNSVTKYIKLGMKEAGFNGEIRLEHEPLQFYTNAEHFLAAGDLMLMQNDWTDNYH